MKRLIVQLRKPMTDNCNLEVAIAADLKEPGCGS